MPFSLKLLVSVLALVVIGVGAAVVLLRPPASLEVPVQGIVLSGVTLINPGLDRRPNQRVTVRNGRIDSIEDAPAEAGDPSAFYRGTYVLPGLIDMHVHNPPPPSSDFGYFMLMYLAYGVTTIRDTGNDGQMFAGRKLIAEGKLAGPKLAL